MVSMTTPASLARLPIDVKVRVSMSMSLPSEKTTTSLRSPLGAAARKSSALRTAAIMCISGDSGSIAIAVLAALSASAGAPNSARRLVSDE